MKKVLIGICVIVVIVAVFLVLAAFDIFDIGESLGLTATCSVWLCNNPSRTFGNLCSPCQDLLDSGRQILDGIFDIFR